MNNQVISVWKDTGLTSLDVVNSVKKEMNIRKVGHCGTLDPFAEGVLVLCTGEKTKNVAEVMGYEKEYIATIFLGEETDTLDVTGSTIRTSNNTTFTLEKIEEVIQKYEGEIYQAPPYYSALKFHGIRLYEYARRGIYIRKKPRKIYIKKIKFLELNKNELSIYVKCQKGTYIRSLARDIAYDLNTYGHLIKLTRIAVGPFNKENSLLSGDFL